MNPSVACYYTFFAYLLTAWTLVPSLELISAAMSNRLDLSDYHRATSPAACRAHEERRRRAEHERQRVRVVSCALLPAPALFHLPAATSDTVLLPIPPRALESQQRRAQRLIADTNDQGEEQEHERRHVIVVPHALLPTPVLLDCPATAHPARLLVLSEHNSDELKSLSWTRRTEAESRGMRGDASTSSLVICCPLLPSSARPLQCAIGHSTGRVYP